MYPCPCCGYRTLGEKPPGTYLICPICCWEDAAADNELDSDEISLRWAQQNFLAFGACEQEWLDYVRAATPTDQRDPDWLTLDEKACAAGPLLIKQITKAFEGVTRDGGVSLHEARAIDDYEGAQGRAEARKKDTDCRWQDVPDEWIEYFFDVFHFFDAKGFRYYLPAYMIFSIKNYRSSQSNSVDTTIYTLSVYEGVDDPCNRFRLLNAEQSKAVCNFLKFMDAYGADWGYARTARRALNQYWDQVNPGECK